MNKDNGYCVRYTCNKQCDTIIIPCDECGKLCVFESDKQPAKGCPQNFNIMPKHEYNVCSVCDHRFCDEHMGSTITCVRCEADY